LVSIVIRMKMNESPLFAKLKSEGKTSTNPLKESFGKKQNMKMVLLALFGATMGQGVIWYTGQFYAQTFLLKTCNLEPTQTNTWIGIALLLATPFFVFFGWLSDKIGRKAIMLTGMLLAIFCYRPIFSAMYNMSDVKQKQELSSEITTQKIISSENPKDSIIFKTTVATYSDHTKLAQTEKYTQETLKPDNLKLVETKKIVTLDGSYRMKLISLVFILVLFVTMVYGPIAAFLVELFPTKIRYTSMSLPYHIGNGVFGGLVPFIATLITVTPGSNYLSGLWYPIGVAAICLVIGTLYLTNKKDENVADDVNEYIQ
jgi:MFS family permease